ncbi:MAG: imelysin family protein [Alphaproteobacteria bacterium]
MKLLTTMIMATAIITSAASAENYATNFANSAEVVNNLTDNIVMSNYNYMEETAKKLVETTKELQADVSMPNLRKAQEAWRESRIGFEVAEAHLFGPVVSLGVDPALDSWPLDTEQMAFSANIAKGIEGDDLEKFVTSLNENVTGYHAVEYVLFGEENNKQPEDFTETELAYLVLLANIIDEKSVELKTAWLEETEDAGPAYAPLLKTSAEGNDAYADTKSALEEYVSGMITIVDEVGTGKLIDPMGDSIATANPMLVESQYSWNSSTDFFWDIAGVWQVWYGDSAITGNEGLGIRDVVAASNEELAQKIDGQINKALETIVAISFSQYENGSGAIFKNKGDIITLAGLIDKDDKEKAFRSQISLVSGRKRIAQAEEALDALSKSLADEVLPNL